MAKSVGTGKAKREAALAKKRGISKTSKPESLQIDAQVQRNKGKVRGVRFNRESSRFLLFYVVSLMNSILLVRNGPVYGRLNALCRQE